MIELIVFDIDGVITDGSVIIDSHGNEQKRINLKDIDGIYELHRKGYKLAAITGENTDIVNYFEKRFPWDYFYRGNKKKKETLIQIEKITGINRKNICYIGDGKYDLDPLAYAGLGICPADAIAEVKYAADIILQHNGGEGCIWELVSVLENYHHQDVAESCFYSNLEEHIHVFKMLFTNQECMRTVFAIGDKIMNIFKNKKTLYLCENDDHLSNAQVFKSAYIRCFSEKMDIKVWSAHPSVWKKEAVKEYAQKVSVFQSEKKIYDGDILFGILTNNTGENVEEVLKYGSENGMITVLLTGAFENASLYRFVDYVIKIPSSNPIRIQEACQFISHVVAEYIKFKMFGRK